MKPKQQVPTQPNDDDFDFDKNIDNGLPPISNLPQKDGDKKKADDKKDDDDDDDDDDPFKLSREKKDEDRKDEDRKDEDRKDEDKKGKDESIATLRKQRDEARSEIDSWKQAAGDLGPEEIKLVTEYLSNEDGGVLDKETIKNIIVEAKQSKEIISEKDKKIEELQKKVKDLDIRYSDDFNKQFIQPLHDKAASLHVEISNLDKEGKIIAPAATEKFHKELMSMKELDPKKVKQIMASFASDFEKESGIKYDAPSVSTVMTALRDFSSANEKMAKAYSEWDTEKKKAAEAIAKERRENQEFTSKQLQRQRRTAAVTALKRFDLDAVDGILEDSDVEKTFREVFQDGEAVFESPDKAPPYEELITRSAKAAMFDKLVTAYKDLLKWKKSQEEEDKDKIKGKGSATPGDNEEDWLP